MTTHNRKHTAPVRPLASATRRTSCASILVQLIKEPTLSLSNSDSYIVYSIPVLFTSYTSVASFPGSLPFVYIHARTVIPAWTWILQKSTRNAAFIYIHVSTSYNIRERIFCPSSISGARGGTTTSRERLITIFMSLFLQKTKSKSSVLTDFSELDSEIILSKCRIVGALEGTRLELGVRLATLLVNTVVHSVTRTTGAGLLNAGKSLETRTNTSKPWALLPCHTQETRAVTPRHVRVGVTLSYIYNNYGM